MRVESPAFEGRSFGPIGTYDRIVARATIAVRPDDAHNTVIVDLDRAPRNAQGLVEAVTDVEILRPTNAANGNRRLLYEALNRGTKPGFALLNDLPVPRQRFRQSLGCRQRLPDEPRLHCSVERLAGRYRAGRRSHDILPADRGGDHRPGARGFYL